MELPYSERKRQQDEQLEHLRTVAHRTGDYSQYNKALESRAAEPEKVRQRLADRTHGGSRTPDGRWRGHVKLSDLMGDRALRFLLQEGRATVTLRHPLRKGSKEKRAR